MKPLSKNVKMFIGIVNQFDEVDFAIIYKRFSLNYKKKEVANFLGLSPTAIRKREERIKEIIDKYFVC